MQVQQIYQLALLLLVVPSILINRVGGVVALAWVLGELAHLVLPLWFSLTPMELVPLEDAANMFSYVLALGAGMALAGDWNTSLKSRGRWIVALLFAPLSVMAFVSANLEPSRYYSDYQIATAIYWPLTALLFAQIIAVLISNDWSKAWDFCCKADAALWRSIYRHFEKMS